MRERKVLDVSYGCDMMMVAGEIAGGAMMTGEAMSAMRRTVVRPSGWARFVAAIVRAVA